MRVIGVLGGTGPEGRGLALRFALAGRQVLVGSRDEGRAVAAATSVSENGPAGLVSGALNRVVAGRADPVFVTLPYAGHRQTLTMLRDELNGKVIVDAVAPLAFEKGVAKAVTVPEGSAALEAQAVLPGSTVVAAFQTVSAQDLLRPHKHIDSDVLVCADDPRARDMVMRLAELIEGVRAVDCGGLENSADVERVTALLLNLNHIHKTRSAIKIVGV